MTTTTKSNKKFTLIFGLLAIVGGIYGTSKYLHAQAHEETDDAQVEKNMNPIIPRVSGYITKVYVKDNDYVKKGDTLFVLDNRDYIVKIEEANAALASAQSTFEVSQADAGSAQANIAVSNANVVSANGNIENAKVKLWRANNDFTRYENLYKNHSITKQQFEQALATKQEAENQLNILISQQKSAAYQKNVVVSKTVVTNKQSQVAIANIKRAQAMLDAAKLNLEYTVVKASIDGQVAKIAIQPGQLVQPGQSLFYLVNNNEIWVIANFKETQLAKMKMGQKAKIKVDAFDNEEFSGQLSSFSPATGSQFSILPPDNATGNFVKTVQRVPVKISFDTTNQPEKIKQLRSGMSVQVDIQVQ